MPYDLLSASAPFTLGEVQTSKRGQKFQVIQPTTLWQLTSLDNPFFCPFGANVFKGDGTETRLNLDVRVDDATANIFRALDMRFKELIGPQKSQYHNLVHEDAEYGPRIRMKVSCTGLGAAMLWSPDKKRLGTCKEYETRGASIVPVAMFTKVWYMGCLLYTSPSPRD